MPLPSPLPVSAVGAVAEIAIELGNGLPTWLGIELVPANVSVGMGAVAMLPAKGDVAAPAATTTEVVEVVVVVLVEVSAATMARRRGVEAQVPEAVVAGKAGCFGGRTAVLFWPDGATCSASISSLLTACGGCLSLNNRAAASRRVKRGEGQDSALPHGPSRCVS